VPTWASTAAQDTDKWEVVKPKAEQRRVQAQVIVQSKKAVDESSSLKGVPRLVAPRMGVLHAFVGRLDIETTEEALSTYVTDVGIKGVVCKKLKAKNGKQFRTAAFYVSWCCESKELFYNESCWSEGVELRLDLL